MDNSKKQKGIVLFNINFNFFKRFESLTLCGKFFGVSASSFSSVINSTKRVYKDEYFVFTDDEVINKIPEKFFKELKKQKEAKELSDLVMSSLPSKRELTKKALIAVSINTGVILNFDSLIEASTQLGVNKGAISDSASNLFTRKVGGYFFLYDTLENNTKVRRLLEILRENQKMMIELNDLFPNVSIKKFL